MTEAARDLHKRLTAKLLKAQLDRERSNNPDIIRRTTLNFSPEPRLNARGRYWKD